MTMSKTAKPVRRSQSERSADTRRKVIDAAVRLLAERGYAAATTTTVALEAGVTRGAMFHQYPTKVDLMLDVARLKYDQEKRFYEDVLDPIEDVRERFFGIPEAMWELEKRPLGVALIEILNGSRGDPDLAARLEPLETENNIYGMAKTATALAEAGLTIAPPDLPMVRLVMASIRGLVMERVLSSNPAELDESVVRLREIMESFYGAQSPDLAP